MPVDGWDWSCYDTGGLIYIILALPKQIVRNYLPLFFLLSGLMKFIGF
jgi:hypothetical protein